MRSGRIGRDLTRWPVQRPTSRQASTRRRGAERYLGYEKTQETKMSDF
ncbi:MAG: serine protease, partial [Mesorhizobium sp.]